MAAIGRSRGAVAGAVLTGGASSRMGTDKAVLAVEGIPLAVRAVATLRAAGAEPVVVVGGDLDALATLGLHAVADRWPGAGPLGAIVTALTQAGGADVVVLACDVPLVSPTTVARLVAADAAADVVMAVAASSSCMSSRPPTSGVDADPERPGLPEPLVACYRGRSRAHLQAAFDTGERAVHRALAGLAVATVATPADELANLNRPEDLPALEGKP